MRMVRTFPQGIQLAWEWLYPVRFDNQRKNGYRAWRSQHLRPCNRMKQAFRPWNCKRSGDRYSPRRRGENRDNSGKTIPQATQNAPQDPCQYNQSEGNVVVGNSVEGRRWRSLANDIPRMMAEQSHHAILFLNSVFAIHFMPIDKTWLLIDSVRITFYSSKPRWIFKLGAEPRVNNVSMYSSWII